MSAKKKSAAVAAAKDVVTLSDVDLALISGEIDRELSRLGVTLEPVRLPQYGYSDIELQRTKYASFLVLLEVFLPRLCVLLHSSSLRPRLSSHYSIDQKLYFSSADLDGLVKQPGSDETRFDAHLAVAEAEGTENEVPLFSFLLILRERE